MLAKCASGGVWLASRLMDDPLEIVGDWVDALTEQYGKDGKVFEIHAGLECGALQSKYPGMDLISVGPDITGVHSPDEKVSIESSRRTYLLVREVIRELHASKQ